jgi:hypothetical protein
MITIDDPPAANACSTCMSPLLWLYSYRTGRTFSVVAVDHETLRVHGCKELQDPRTWRDVRRGTPPTDDYVQAKQQLTERPDP